ncbi:MAG TPA: hypothetical protein VHI13_18945 [Candidatus Kapabacteria bacterium]|nr:hypothetical protein [Candidatus Kapabacteria bacterium]
MTRSNRRITAAAIALLVAIGTMISGTSAHAQCQVPTIFNNAGCTITVEFRDNTGNIVGPHTMAPGTNWLPTQPPGWSGINSYRLSLPGLVPPWVGAWVAINPAGGCGPCVNAGCCCVQGCGNIPACRFDFNACGPC